MKSNIPNVTDSYMWEKTRMILTKAQLHIPGLEMIGHCLYETTPFSLPAHTHKGCIEIVYLVNGVQPYSIGSHSYQLTGNQLLITPAGIIHSSGEALHGRYEIYWLRIEKKVGKQFLSLCEPFSHLLHQALCQLGETIVSPNINLRGKWQMLFSRLADPDPLLQLQGLSLLQEVLSMICQPVDHRKPVISVKMVHVINYIQAHLFDDIALEDLADLAGLSLSHFKQRFQKETGISPREFINLRKVEKAKDLLRAGVSITDTAFRLGFSSSSYFSVMFKKNTGKSPSAYLKAAEKKENKSQ